MQSGSTWLALSFKTPWLPTTAGTRAAAGRGTRGPGRISGTMELFRKGVIKSSYKSLPKYISTFPLGWAFTMGR